MHKYLLFLTALFFSIPLFFSCDENSTEPENGSNILVINHYGVDWSEGLVGSDTENVESSDGETIAWCPNGDGGGWLSGIWYRSGKDHIYKYGSGNLSDVTGVDVSRWSDDVCSTPLKNGDLWVAETLDGYVAFKVLDAPTDSAGIANRPLWSVEVEYKFSTTTGF